MAFQPCRKQRRIAGDFHFIICSGYHRQAWLGSARRRDLLLTVLQQVRQRYGVVILGYADQWRWSSFRSYAYGEAGLVKINDWQVLKMKIHIA